MKSLALRYSFLAAVCAVCALSACKAKKAIQKPAAPVTTPVQPPKPPAEEKQPEPTPPPPPPAPAEKPNYNFKNIQFEFNSAVLKTSSYPILDQMASEMKKDNSAQFLLNGHSSTEGTAEHNMALSVERANAVKTYLINTGIDASRMEVKGYGETKPIAPNNTEEGKALNRRVEVKLKS